MSSNRAEPASLHATEDWFSPRRFALLLAALICAAYPDVITGQGTFFHRDFSVFGYPLAFYHRECFWRGEVPLWNPYNDCGLPFLAQWNTMTLYPLSLFYLLLPISWSLGVFCLGHLYLGGLGMYFLAHRWSGNRFAGAVAGVAFAFNAVLLNALMWPNNISALAWLPWVVLAAERGWREGGRWLLLAVAAGAMQMLTGAPEVILLTWVLLAALLLGQMTLASANRWRMPLRFLLMGLWVGGLAAAQLLPFLDLLTHSQRNTAYGGSLWSMPAWGLANLLVPLFRTYRTPLGIYVQPDQYWVSSYYPGIAVLVFAFLAALLVRRARVFLLSALVVMSLLLCLGDQGWFYSGLKRLLPLGFMRYPIKFILLPTVILPLLAALFVGHYASLSPAGQRRCRLAIMLVEAAFLAIVGGVILSGLGYHPKDLHVGPVLTSGLSRAAFLVFTMAALLAAGLAAPTPIRLLSQFGLLALLWLDPLTVGPRPNPTVPRWAYQPGLARQELKLSPSPQIGQARLLLDTEAEASLMHVPMTNGLDLVLYQRLALDANINLLDGIPKVVGMYSLYLKELGEVLPLLWSTPPISAGLGDFLAVSHVNAPGKINHWQPRPNPLAWATAGQQPLFADATNTLAALSAEDFDPRRMVFLPLECRAGLPVSHASAASVVIRQFATHKVRLEVDAPEPALVVIAQSYYHNWRAYLDGNSIPLLRANHAFQTLTVPAGRHNITLRYEDRAFFYGALSSIVSAGLWAGFYLRARRARLVDQGGVMKSGRTAPEFTAM